MELIKTVIFLFLTIMIIYNSDAFSAGLNSNFDICGVKCGFGVNGAIPNACQYSTLPAMRYGNSLGCSSKMSQLSQKFYDFLRKKELFLKQLFARFQTRNSCQTSCPFISVNLTPTIEKLKLPNNPQKSSCNCSPETAKLQISPRENCDYVEECSDNCDNNCSPMV